MLPIIVQMMVAVLETFSRFFISVLKRWWSQCPLVIQWPLGMPGPESPWFWPVVISARFTFLYPSWEDILWHFWLKSHSELISSRTVLQRCPTSFSWVAAENSQFYLVFPDACGQVAIFLLTPIVDNDVALQWKKQVYGCLNLDLS